MRALLFLRSPRSFAAACCVLLTVVLLAACATVPPAPTPPAATPGAALPTAVVAPGTAAPAPSSTAVPASPSAATIAPTPSPTPAAVTPTPPFPTETITTTNIGRLAPLRSIGLGRGLRAALAPEGNRLAVGTSAGVALYALPALQLERFGELPGGVAGLALGRGGRLALSGQGQTTTELQRAGGGSIATLAGVAPVFSPDGTLVATLEQSAAEPKIRLWRSADGAAVATLGGAQPPVFSPDGTLLAVETPGGMTRIVRPDGSELAPVEGFGPVFSPDGKLLATVQGASGVVQARLWDVATARPAGTLALGDTAGAPPTLAFSADSATLYAVAGQQLQAWNPAQGRREDIPLDVGMRPRFAPTGGVLTFVRFGGEGLLGGIVFARSANGTVIFADDAAFFSDDLSAAPVAFSADGASAAYVTFDGQVRLLELARASTRDRQLPGFTSLALSPDGRTLAAGRAGPEAWLYRVADSTIQQQLRAADPSPLSRYPRRMEFSPDGGRLVAEEERITYGAISVAATEWQLAGAGPGTVAWELTAVDDGASLFSGLWAYSPASQAVAWVEGGALQLRRSGALTETIARAGGFTALAFDPSGATLAASDASEAVRLLSLQGASQPGEQVLQAGAAATALAFSQDGSHLAALAEGGGLIVWKLDAAQPGLMLRTAGATAIAFSPNNQLIAVSDARGIAIYSLGDGRELRRLITEARALAFGPAGKLLAVLSDERIVLWGVER